MTARQGLVGVAAVIGIYVTTAFGARRTDGARHRAYRRDSGDHLVRIGRVDKVIDVAEFVGARRYGCVMSSPDNAGKVRYTYRLRLSAGVERLLAG